MKMKETDIDGIESITIEEKDANLSVADGFRERMFSKIAESTQPRLIISFKKVEYVDSSFLGALVSILKKLLPLQGKLVLIEMNTEILNLFELTRLDKVFTLEKSLEDALKHFR